MEVPGRRGETLCSNVLSEPVFDAKLFPPALLLVFGWQVCLYGQHFAAKMLPALVNMGACRGAVEMNADLMAAAATVLVPAALCHCVCRETCQTAACAQPAS